MAKHALLFAQKNAKQRNSKTVSLGHSLVDLRVQWWARWELCSGLSLVRVLPRRLIRIDVELLRLRPFECFSDEVFQWVD